MSVWKATNDRVVVQVTERPTQTESGLILVNKNKAVVEQGTVLAVGDDVSGLKVGDVILYEAKFAIQVATGVVSVVGSDVLAGIREE